MSTHSPAGQEFHEIAGVGTSFPRASRWVSSAAADSTAVEYWSPGEVVPELAEKLMTAVLATIQQQFNANPNALRIRYRVAPSSRIAGHYDTRAVLLYCPGDEGPGHVERMRSAAACLLAGLQEPVGARDRAAGSFLKAEETAVPVASLLSLPVSKFLGCPITDDLVAHISGRAPLELQHRFRDAPRQTIAAEPFEVRGRLSTTKSAGRFRSVGVAAFRVDSRAEFNQPKVVHGEELREAIARAVREPGRRLRMGITRTTVYCGRAKPQITYTLTTLRFDD